MNRIPLAILGAALVAVLGTAGGYNYWHKHAASPAGTNVAGVPCVSGGTPQVEKFQPYVLVNHPLAKPAHVTEYHRRLRLAPHNGHEYLADASGRYYDIGRDHQGHIYPAYYDRVTDQYYPLYYDHSYDRYYRVCQDNGAYYQCYVDDPDSRFYRCDEDIDYADYEPPVDDCPIISDPYTSFTCYDQPAYYYDPVVYERRWHHNDWLWAAPVVIGAYFVLDQDSYPAHCWYYGYNDGPDIEPSVYYQTIYRAPVSFWDGGRQYQSYVSVAPPLYAQAPQRDWSVYDRYGTQYGYRRYDPYGHFAQHPQIAMDVTVRNHQTVALSRRPVDPTRVSAFGTGAAVSRMAGPSSFLAAPRGNFQVAGRRMTGMRNSFAPMPIANTRNRTPMNQVANSRAGFGGHGPMAQNHFANRQIAANQPGARPANERLAQTRMNQVAHNPTRQIATNHGGQVNRMRRVANYHAGQINRIQRAANNRVAMYHRGGGANIAHANHSFGRTRSASSSGGAYRPAQRRNNFASRPSQRTSFGNHYAHNFGGGQTNHFNRPSGFGGYQRHFTQGSQPHFFAHVREQRAPQQPSFRQFTPRSQPQGGGGGGNHFGGGGGNRFGGGGGGGGGQKPGGRHDNGR